MDIIKLRCNIWLLFIQTRTFIRTLLLHLRVEDYSATEAPPTLSPAYYFFDTYISPVGNYLLYCFFVFVSYFLSFFLYFLENVPFCTLSFFLSFFLFRLFVFLLFYSSSFVFFLLQELKDYFSCPLWSFIH